MEDIKSWKTNKSEFDVKKFEICCELLATKSDIANVMNISASTLARKVKEHYGLTFKAVQNTFGTKYKLHLRQLLLRQAEGIPSFKYIRGKKGKKEKVLTGWILHPSGEMQKFLALNILGFSNNPSLNANIEDNLNKFAELMAGNYSRRKDQPKLKIKNDSPNAS